MQLCRRWILQSCQTLSIGCIITRNCAWTLENEQYLEEDCQLRQSPTAPWHHLLQRIEGGNGLYFWLVIWSREVLLYCCDRWCATEYGTYLRLRHLALTYDALSLCMKHHHLFFIYIFIKFSMFFSTSKLVDVEDEEGNYKI